MQHRLVGLVRSIAVIAGVAAAVGLMTPAAAASRSVSIGDDFFSPDSVTVSVGDSVTWRNGGGRGHSVKAQDGSFDSNPSCSFENKGPCLQPGQTFSVTFSRPGTYFYYCNVHGQANGIGMAGQVTVASEGATTSTTAGTTTTTRRTTTSTTAAATTTTAKPGSTTTTAKATTTTTGPTTTTDAATGTVVVPGRPASTTTIPLAPVSTLAVRDTDSDGDGTMPIIIGLLVVLAAGLVTAAWYFRPRKEPAA